MTYNALGQRVSKVTPSGTTNFRYDGNNLIEETADNGDPITSYTVTNEEYGDLVSETDFDEYGTGSEFYQQFDAQAAVNALIDDSGSVAQSYRFKAFGLPDTSMSTGMTWGAKKQYYTDAELELYFLGTGTQDGGGRYYDPASGKFLSDDPFRQAAGDLNLSRYVRNNPVQTIDPGGKAAFDEEAMLYFRAMFGIPGEKMLKAVQGAGIRIEFVPEDLQGMGYVVTGSKDNQVIRISTRKWRNVTADSISGFVWGSLGRESFVDSGSKSPVTAAHELLEGLKKAFRSPGWHLVAQMTQQLQDEISGAAPDSGDFQGTVDNYLALRERQFQQGAAAAAQIAESYVRGVTLISEGTNIVVSIGDIADGNSVAALNLVPLIGGLTLAAGKKLILRVGKKEFSAGTQRLQQILEDEMRLQSVRSANRVRSANPVEGLPRVGSALKTDPAHAFSDLMDNFAGNAQKFMIPTKGPGGVVLRQSELYQLEGSMILKGKQTSGVFEWIVDEGKVTHRMFVPGGRATGNVGGM